MTFLWIALASVAVLLWVLTIADIVRSHRSGWPMIGWIAFVFVLPIIGATIYWISAGRTASDPELQAMAEADIRRTGPSR